MKTRIISVANHKGGVAKTTTVVNLGYSLASKGYKVLLIDLDAQTNLTSICNKNNEERTIYNALMERKDIPIVKLSDHIDLVPSGRELVSIELQLSGAYSREYILKDLIDEVQDHYNYILIDCPPSLGLLVINAFTASNEVLIPLTAEALPFEGLLMIQDAISLVAKRLNDALRLEGIVITRWNNRRLNKDVEEALRGAFDNLVYRTKISENIKVAEAPLHKMSIIDFAPSSKGAKNYTELANEFITRHKA